MVFVSAFCLGGRLADRLGQSGRNGSERFPSDRKRSPEMSMATTRHENVSMESQFIDMSRHQQCRWACKFAPADGFEAS